MKLHLTFEEKDFENMRSFEKAVKRQLGNNVYVGSDSLCVYFDYPRELALNLRPRTGTGTTPTQLEFDLESSLPDQRK